MRINLEKSSGIYQIRNAKNQKRYIGLSKNVFNRCSEHLYALRSGKHTNDYLQKAWNADPEAFVFEIIEYCGVDYLENREIYWIAYYNTTDQANGYNHTIGGNHLCGENASWWGRKHSQETKDKMSESARTRPSNRLPKSAEFVEHLREISMGENNVFYGKHHSEETKRKISEFRHEYNKTHKSPTNRSVVQLDIDGQYLHTYESGKAASIAVSRSYSTLSGACSGRQLTCAGYKWMYEADYLAMIGSNKIDKEVEIPQ